MDSSGLEIDQLTKTYGERKALDGVTFTVAPGEIFGFVGSNGAGKSTTMRIALGVLAADAGHVRINGQPIDTTTRRLIGYMPEERGLYPKMRVGEQLVYLAQLHGFSKDAAVEQMRRLLDRLGISERQDATVDSLSLGNQQRVQLAAALVHDPQVLILDEPFSGLDPIAVDVMSNVLIEKAEKGVPVIFSSHQLELVQAISDRVGVIALGKMCAVGTVDELRTRDGIELVFVAPNAPSGWADSIPGIIDVQYGPSTTLTVTPEFDTQFALNRALDTGPVYEFTTRKPNLTEVFREVVSA